MTIKEAFTLQFGGANHEESAPKAATTTISRPAMSGHTPGGYVDSCADERAFVRLANAAPELLAALEGLATAVGEANLVPVMLPENPLTVAFTAARAAIRKARTT